jgi:Raf kinase inhibitor-like YbhB/YbcL family protein
MELRSPDFEHNTLIPSRYTCDGEDINPELEIVDVPPGTNSLVLIMDDPDASVGNWTHWLLWNIDPDTERIPVGTEPVGSVEGMNSFGHSGYGGPCPHGGTHRYVFKLFALDTKLNLTPSAEKTHLLDAMNEHLIDQCELIGLYSRGDD